MQMYSDVVLGRNISPTSWHPRITPYRFIILATTLGLGTAKAVLTQRGNTVASVTLEWVLGTAIVLLSFGFSAYDSGEDHPLYLAWLFKPDCMDLAWPILAIFSIPQPQYISNEKITTTPPYLDHPPITLYRILVCVAVTSFGISKALLGYYELSTVVTWIDWALAVPITISLYVLGLYEYNSLSRWSSFFIADHYEIFYSFSIGLNHTAGILLSSAWSAGCGYALWYTFHHSDWNVKPTLQGDRNISLRTRIEAWSPVGTTVLYMEVISFALAGGLAGLFVVLRSVVKDVAARQNLQHRTPWSFSLIYHNRSITFNNALFRILASIIYCLFVIVSCLAFAATFSPVIFTLFDMVINKDLYLEIRIGSFLAFAVCGPIILGSVFMALSIVFVFGPLMIFISLYPRR